MRPSTCHGQRCTSSLPPQSPCHRLARSRSEQTTCPFPSTRPCHTIPPPKAKRRPRQTHLDCKLNCSPTNLQPHPRKPRLLTPTFYNPQLISPQLNSTYLIQHFPVSTTTPHHSSSAPPRPRPIVYAPAHAPTTGLGAVGAWGPPMPGGAADRGRVGDMAWDGTAWRGR
jgi:hypothetical protein